MSEVDAVPGRERVLDALDELQADLESGADWENNTLERFLDGFSALLSSIENAYTNTGRAVPTDPWVILAEVFRGARYYE